MKKTEHKPMKDIKKELFKLRKFGKFNGLAVKIYNCDEDYSSYEVEINTYFFGELKESFVNTVFSCELGQDDQIKEMEKQASKRAKAILKTVNNWFEDTGIEISEEVEMYHT